MATGAILPDTLLFAAPPQASFSPDGAAQSLASHPCLHGEHGGGSRRQRDSFPTCREGKAESASAPHAALPPEASEKHRRERTPPVVGKIIFRVMESPHRGCADSSMQRHREPSAPRRADPVQLEALSQGSQNTEQPACSPQPHSSGNQTGGAERSLHKAKRNESWRPLSCGSRGLLVPVAVPLCSMGHSE